MIEADSADALSMRGNFLNTTGMIAVCSRGIPGIIIKDTKQSVTYPDGSTGEAYVGIALFTGKPWSSRSPIMVGRFHEFLATGAGDFAGWCCLKGAKLTVQA